MTREEVKKKIYDKKVKKALKCYRFRPLKNFIFWFAGVLSSVAVVAGAIFVGVKVVPISTYTGGVEKEYVSEELAAMSILDAVLNFEQISFSDIPGVTDMLIDVIDDSGADQFININREKLNQVQFVYGESDQKKFLTELLGCITINPAVLGDAGEISAFNEYQQVPDQKKEDVIDDNGIKKITEGESTTLSSNPKNYYYDANEQSSEGDGAQPMAEEQGNIVPNYKRAFNDDGTWVIAAKGKKLYYPALKDVPVMDLTELIDEVFARVEVGEVLSIALKSNDDSQKDGTLLNSLIKSFEGKTLDDLDNAATAILDNITFETIAGEQGKEMFSSFGKLSVFSWGEKVLQEELDQNLDEDGNIKKITTTDPENPDADATEKFSVSPKLYYYLSNGEYLRAFDDQGVRVEDAQNVVDFYYANLFEAPISSVLEVFGTSFTRVEITEIFTSTGIELEEGNIIEPLFEGIKIGDLGVEGLATDLLNKVSLETFGGEDALGAFGKLTMFNDWEKVLLEDKPVLIENKLNVDEYDVNLFYYVADETKIEGSEYTDDAFAKAFDEQGYFVGDSYDQTDLYYAKLMVVGFSDMTTLISQSLNRITVKELINSMSDAPIKNGDLMDEILGDKTIGEISKIGSDEDPILLTMFMPFVSGEEGNSDTYKILLEAVGETVTDSNLEQLANQLTVNKISNDFDFDKVKLGSFVSESTLKLLVSAINTKRKTENPEDFESVSNDTISVSNMKEFDAKYIKLCDVLGETINGEIKELLEQITGKSYEELTVDKLGGNLTFDEIKLNTILPYKEYEEDGVTVKQDRSNLYNILLEAVKIDANEENAKEFKIGDIKSSDFSVNNIKFTTIITKNTGTGDSKNNEMLFNIVEKVVDKGEDGVINIGDFANFSVDNLPLSTLLKPEDNQTLFNVLREATGQTSNDAIWVSHLKSFSLDNVKLGTVLTEPTGNNILESLRTNKEVNLSNIGTKLNTLTLYEVYGTECFVKKSGNEDVIAENSPKFKAMYEGEKLVGYEHDESVSESEAYYLHKDAGIWLLLCFSGEEYEDSTDGGIGYDTDGRPEIYRISNRMIEDLQNASIFTEVFENATIRQFMDAGIISSADVSFRTLKLHDVLNPQTH